MGFSRDLCILPESWYRVMLQWTSGTSRQKDNDPVVVAVKTGGAVNRQVVVGGVAWVVHLVGWWYARALLLERSGAFFQRLWPTRHSMVHGCEAGSLRGSGWVWLFSGEFLDATSDGSKLLFWPLHTLDPLFGRDSRKACEALQMQRERFEGNVTWRI
jgi:hypothetical protein